MLGELKRIGQEIIPLVIHSQVSGFLRILLVITALSACTRGSALDLETQPTKTIPTSKTQLSATPAMVDEEWEIGSKDGGSSSILQPTITPIRNPEVTSPPSSTRITAIPSVETPPPDQVSTCDLGLCYYPGIFLLDRPIMPPANDQIDISYRFGSTQRLNRPPHHGVEFENPPGTSVYAVADGVAVVAGTDKEINYGPFKNFYGNLVIIQHDFPEQTTRNFPPFPTPVYTLYAHLSAITVQLGQEVHRGQEIGRVGMTGNAIGNHLHFEVRLGENTYHAVSNPELWLIPKFDMNGLAQGALIGQAIDLQGNPIELDEVTIQFLPDGPESPTGPTTILHGYEEKTLLSQQPWYESFAISNLSAGWYRVSFPYNGIQSQVVQVLPDQVSVVVFKLK